MIRIDRAKRGQFFITLIFLIFGSAVLFGFAYFQIYKLKENHEVTLTNGEIALEKLYTQGHNVQKYVDLSAQLSFDESLYDFEKNGHFTDCGYAENYYYWKNKSVECYPNKVNVRKGFSNIFEPRFNELILKFGLIDGLNLSRSYDTEFDVGKGYVKGLRFSYVNLSGEKIQYFVNRNFKLDVDYDFNYSSIVDGINLINEECSDKENYNANSSYELDDCAHTVINQINLNKSFGKELWSLNCDGGDEAILNSFAQKVNNCFMSSDTDCSCGINTEEAKSFGFVGNKVSFKNKSVDLLQDFPNPFTFYEIFKKGDKLYSRDTWVNSPDREIQILAVDARTYGQCRYNDRTVKLCVTSPNNVSIFENSRRLNKKIQTKFAIYVPDKSSPPAVEFNVSGNSVSWTPSVAGDVEEYMVLGVSKDITDPKWEDAEILVSVLRDDNIDIRKTVQIDGLDRLNIKVIAVDDDENYDVSK